MKHAVHSIRRVVGASRNNTGWTGPPALLGLGESFRGLLSCHGDFDGWWFQEIEGVAPYPGGPGLRFHRSREGSPGSEIRCAESLGAATDRLAQAATTHASPQRSTVRLNCVNGDGSPPGPRPRPGKPGTIGGGSGLGSTGATPCSRPWLAVPPARTGGQDSPISSRELDRGVGCSATR